MSSFDELILALSKWPLDCEQKDLIIQGTAVELEGRQAEELVRQLGDAESAVTSWADLRDRRALKRERIRESLTRTIHVGIHMLRRPTWPVAIFGAILLGCIIWAIVYAPAARTEINNSFFDKYGDEIFYGLLLFPIFGSAIAGVASYLRAEAHTRRLRLLHHLIGFLQKARTAPSLEALEQMQLEIDRLVIAVVHSNEDDEYSPSEQMSFSLVLDRVSEAMASRRASLLFERPAVETTTRTRATAA